MSLTKALGTECYFVHPYVANECGLNENTNGLFRQFTVREQT